MSLKIEDFADVALGSLVGEHVLDAVDESTEEIERWQRYESSNCLRFRLDGKVYAAIENPDDGYRSNLDKLVHFPDAKMSNVFPPVRVLGRLRTDTSYGSAEVLQLLHVTNGEVILEVGTDNTDDYYPSFVASWCPEKIGATP